MRIKHNVKQGEHLSLIAVMYGFADHQPIWNDPANAALRQRRKHPHILMPGDIVEIPDRQAREEQG